MYAELGTAAGSITGMGLLVYFINAKVNKKQDKEMCIQKHGTIEKDLGKGDDRFKTFDNKMDKILDSQAEIKGEIIGIKKELEIRNGKT